MKTALLVAALLSLRALADAGKGNHIEAVEDSQPQSWLDKESESFGGRLQEAVTSLHPRAHGMDSRRLLSSRINEPQHMCKDTANLERLIVVAGGRGDLDWIEASGIPYIQYQASNPFKHHYLIGSGGQAWAYLQFIMDYYNCLPKAVAFVRGQCDEDWQKSNERGQFLDSLDLKWDSVASFADIDDKAESRTVLLGDALPRPGKSLASGAQVYNGSFPRQVIGGIAYDASEAHMWLTAQAQIRAYDKHFGAYLGPMPGRITYGHRSEFVATRQAIRLRPRSFYTKTLEYLVRSEICDNGRGGGQFPAEDVVSIYWGMILGSGVTSPMSDCSSYEGLETPARCFGTTHKA